MNLTEENRLIEIPPGRYVRAGTGGDGFKEIIEPTQGLIVKEVKCADPKREFQTVLVDGDLINWWTPKADE